MTKETIAEEPLSKWRGGNNQRDYYTDPLFRVSVGLFKSLEKVVFLRDNFLFR